MSDYSLVAMNNIIAVIVFLEGFLLTLQTARMLYRRSWNMRTAGTLIYCVTFIFFSSKLIEYAMKSSLNLDMIRETNTIVMVWMIIVMTMILLCIEHVHSKRWTSQHVTAQSIKESFDHLPSGVCCYRENGSLLMCNNVMAYIAYQVLQVPFRNGRELYERLQEGKPGPLCLCIRAGSSPVIQTPNGRVYTFSKRVITDDSGRYTELLGSDITEEYRASRTLYVENVKLNDVVKRMKIYSDDLIDTVSQREQLNMRKMVHDNMNLLLLRTQRFLEEGTEAEGDAILQLWKNSSMLEGGLLHEETYDALQDLREAADSIGIELVVNGTLPSDRDRLHVLTVALTECMTNTAKYTDSHKLHIDVSEDQVLIYDDSRIDSGNVREGGGLGFVRLSAEKIGATMKEHSENGFAVQIIWNTGG